MATLEEKQKLFDTLKGPRYFRLTLNGVSCQSNYVQLSQVAYQYWHKVGVSELSDYAVQHGDNEYLNNVPEYADFLTVKNTLGDADAAFFYDEAPGTILEQKGAYYDSVSITLDEIESERWDAKTVKTIVKDEVLDDWINNTNPSSLQNGYITTRQPEYYCQFIEEETDEVFCGLFETIGDFNPSKLMFDVREYWDGQRVIDRIEYDDDVVFNDDLSSNPSGFQTILYINNEAKDMDDEDFKPMFTVEQMLYLGVFDGDYFHTDADKRDLKKKNGIVPFIRDHNLFKPKMSKSMEHWLKKGWITEEDPLGWVQWYARYSNGRRIPKLDKHQIKRWKSFNARTTAMCKKFGEGDITKRLGQRQALLHWACDPIPDIDVENKFEYIVEHFNLNE